MLEIKGYITNLGKYNEGELVGKWLEFPVNDEDLQQTLKEIGCCYYNENGEYINTGYEEFFFTDWESDIELGLDEYESIDQVNIIAESLQDWDEDTLKAACDVWSLSEILDNEPGDYILLSEVNDRYDLGYYYAVEVGCIDFGKNEILERYFDFESYGRDIDLETNGGFTEYGYIECVR